jgi:DNA-binding transcriptional MerR regulator
VGTIFDDGKDAGALRTIGEVGEALGIKAHVLRYWEGQFPMLQPLKRSGGRRYYRAEDIALVQEIDRLVNREGYTLRGAKAALKNLDNGAQQAEGNDGGSKPAAPSTNLQSPARALGASSIETVDKLRSIRATLAAALES